MRSIWMLYFFAISGVLFSQAPSPDTEPIEREEKSVKVITINEAGEKEVIEWDGTGEMPEEVKAYMEQTVIEVPGGKRKKRYERREMMKTVDRRGMRRCCPACCRNNQAPPVMYGFSHDPEDGRFKCGTPSGHEDLIPPPPPQPMGEINNGAYLGIQIANHQGGVKLQEIFKDGPADKAGFERGDIIKKINGAHIDHATQLVMLLGMYRPNDELKVDIMRKGKSKSITCKAGKYPDYE